MLNNLEIHDNTLFLKLQDILERSRTSGRGNDISGSFEKMTYKEFLETKIELATESGFIVDPEKANRVWNPRLHNVGGDLNVRMVLNKG